MTTLSPEARAPAFRGVTSRTSPNWRPALTGTASARSVGALPAAGAAVEAAGATVVTCEPTMQAREAALAEVVTRTGAAVVPPFDHADVVNGQGTIGLEIVQDWPEVDVIVAPIGAHLWTNRTIEQPLTLQWAAKAFLPSAFASLDLERETTDFYRRFFRVTLSPAQVREILSGAW